MTGVMAVLLTQVAIEKKEKAMVARAASWGIPLTLSVRPHWLASRQKHTNHRKVHAPKTTQTHNQSGKKLIFVLRKQLGKTVQFRKWVWSTL